MKDRIKGAIAGAITGVTAGLAGVTRAVAQDDLTDIAAAGNGGTATASANGGAVAVGDINSGGNLGNVIGIGDTGHIVCDKWGKCHSAGGDVLVDGGSVANSTTVNISADGGTAIADASGGDYNIAFVS